MRPNAERSRCVGVFSIVTPSNSSLHGFGDLNVARDAEASRNFELTGSAGTLEVKTSTQPLKFNSAKAMTLETMNGNISLLPVNPSFSGSWSAAAQGAADRAK